MKPCLPTRSVMLASVLFMRVRPHEAPSVLLAVVLAGGGGGRAVVACAAATGTMLTAGLPDGMIKNDARRPQTPTTTMAATRKPFFMARSLPKLYSHAGRQREFGSPPVSLNWKKDTEGSRGFKDTRGEPAGM